MRSSRIPACSSSGEISPSLFVSRAFGSSKCGPRRFASAACFGVGSGVHATSEPRSTSDTTFMGPRLAHARAGGVPTQFLSIPTQTEIISSQRAAYRPRMKRLLLAFVLACRGRRGGAQQAQHAASTGDPGAADKLTEQRRADFKDALAKAFVILDESQQAPAKKLLQDHDVDLDDAPPAREPDSGGEGSD